jgi:hypothetical protein
VRARPDSQGVALTRWSLPKLQAHLAGLGVVLSEETLRQTLIGAGLSHQRTSWRMWTWSTATEPSNQFSSQACVSVVTYAWGGALSSRR